MVNRKTYFDYRKQVYASVNGRIGNLKKLSKSKLIKKDELESLNKVIEELSILSKLIKENGI
jgi:hypothetical protein